MNGNGDAVLWISLVLIAIVLTHQYAPVVKGMLFEPDYWKGKPRQNQHDAFGTRITSNATDAFGTRIAGGGQ